MEKGRFDLKQDVIVVDYDCLTALGVVHETFNRMLACESGLISTRLFKNSLDHYPAGIIKEISGPPGSVQRLTSLMRAAFSGLRNAPFLNDGYVIMATTKGPADEFVRGKRVDLKSLLLGLFEEITSCDLSYDSVQLVSCACATGTVALATGAANIACGNTEVAIVIGVEVLSTFVAAGFRSLKILSSDGAKPFGKNRDGLSLGEAAGFVVLTSRRFQEENRLRSCAQVAGWGITCDAHHISAPRKDGAGLVRAIEMACSNASSPPGAINAHGTGTLYNDAMEINAFRSLWNTDMPPFHSVKGAIGHTLGAAGVVEAAVALESLKYMSIPPTVGTDVPDPEATGLNPSSLQHIGSKTILSCNSGFGGTNACILFEKE